MVIKWIFVIESLVNFIILDLYFMHMFQLSSYFVSKYMRWIKKNYLKILIKEVFILFSFLFFIDNVYFKIVSCFIMGVSIVYNFHRKKQKVKFRFTNRVFRIKILEVFSIVLLFFFFSFDKFCICIVLLNLFSFIACVIFNFIISPVEFVIQKYYITDAKRIMREMKDLIVIGVTGSFGKTSIKNYLYEILSEKYNVLMTPKNYNTTMGVVKTIREELKPTYNVFICEMGATKPRDIKKICNIVNPKIGVISSIAPQHLESFKSIKNVAKTKFELGEAVCRNSGMMFLNFDNEYIRKYGFKGKYTSYGLDLKDGVKKDCCSKILKVSSEGVEFKINGEKYSSSLLGEHNVENLTCCIAVGKYLGVSSEDIKYSVSRIVGVPHRMQVISNEEFTVFDDTYNSNPISSKRSLDTLNLFKGIKKVVTPGLIELGDDERKFNIELGEYISSVCDFAYIVGKKNSKEIIEGINIGIKKKKKKIDIVKVSSPEEGMEKIRELHLKDKVIILLLNDLPDNYD